jgi:hypothetical protein
MCLGDLKWFKIDSCILFFMATGGLVKKEAVGYREWRWTVVEM